MQSSYLKSQKSKQRKHSSEWGDVEDFKKAKKRKEQDYSNQRKNKRGENDE